MAMKAMSLVGLDVHARQTHAAVLVPDTGEVRVSKLRMAPVEVVRFLEGLQPVRAVYEAGPTGFGLARAAHERRIDVRVAAPGSIPKGPGDRVKTDRRDAIRWCGCWPRASWGSRSCPASPTSNSGTSCARSRTCAAI